MRHLHDATAAIRPIEGGPIFADTTVSAAASIATILVSDLLGLPAVPAAWARAKIAREVACYWDDVIAGALARGGVVEGIAAQRLSILFGFRAQGDTDADAELAARATAADIHARTARLATAARVAGWASPVIARVTLAAGPCWIHGAARSIGQPSVAVGPAVASIATLMGAAPAPVLAGVDMTALAANDARPQPGGIESAHSAGPALTRTLGDIWSVRYRGHVAHVRDAKGMQYLERLLAQPGTEIHGAALAACLAPPPDQRVTEGLDWSAPGLRIDSLGDAGEVLDGKAIRAYRARLTSLRRALAACDAEPSAYEDEGPSALPRVRLEREMEALRRELSAAVGLGGRPRRASASDERIRLNITRTIRAAIRRIAIAHPELGLHLAACIRTGTFCSYHPRPQ